MQLPPKAVTTTTSTTTTTPAPFVVHTKTKQQRKQHQNHNTKTGYDTGKVKGILAPNIISENGMAGSGVGNGLNEGKTIILFWFNLIYI